MWLTRLVLSMFLVGMVALDSGLVSSQDYPNKPIRIFTAGAGGSSDFTSRQIAQGISSPLGQPVIVDNRAPILSAEAVSKALPDGYALLVAGSNLWTLSLFQKMSYDPVRDFSPISFIERGVSVLAVHPSLPAKSVKELIALAKARPGELNYSATGIGGPSHLTAELFKAMAGVNIVHISYKSSPEAVTALVSGEVQLMIDDAGKIIPHVTSGRMRALAVTSAQPSALAPGLSTVAASGLPGYELVSSSGIFAPAKTPATIINRLNQEIVRVLNRADMKEKFFNSARLDIVTSSPEELAATMKSEMIKTGKVIKDAGIKVE